MRGKGWAVVELPIEKKVLEMVVECLASHHTSAVLAEDLVEAMTLDAEIALVDMVAEIALVDMVAEIALVDMAELVVELLEDMTDLGSCHLDQHHRTLTALYHSGPVLM